MTFTIVWLVLSTLAAILFAVCTYSDEYQAVRAERIENYQCTQKEKIRCAINGFVMGFLLWPLIVLACICGVIMDGGKSKCR